MDIKKGDLVVLDLSEGTIKNYPRLARHIEIPAIVIRTVKYHFDSVTHCEIEGFSSLAIPVSMVVKYTSAYTEI